MHHESLETFSLRLKRARGQAGMTQRHLAEELQISQRTISDYESGNYYPALVPFRDICLALGASADGLLFGDTERLSVKMDIDEADARFRARAVELVRTAPIHALRTVRPVLIQLFAGCNHA